MSKSRVPQFTKDPIFAHSVKSDKFTYRISRYMHLYHLMTVINDYLNSGERIGVDFVCKEDPKYGEPFYALFVKEEPESSEDDSCVI